MEIRGLDKAIESMKQNQELICKKCNKPIKEDTDGDLKYCQGHSILEQKGVNNDKN
jgi:hypothetical protein